jgi:hypothetical protein
LLLNLIQTVWLPCLPYSNCTTTRFGIYNVGWVSVRRCEEGIKALRWWRERCIEWCHDFVDGDRFADQRYLDRLPGLFPHVHVIQHLGANLAPWNRVFHAPFSELMRQRIYQPYIVALDAAELEARPYLQDDPTKIIRKPAIGSPLDHLFNVFRRARTLAFRGLDIVTGRAIASPSSSAR